jgi:hypothetical protein
MEALMVGAVILGMILAVVVAVAAVGALIGLFLFAVGKTIALLGGC